MAEKRFLVRPLCSHFSANRSAHTQDAPGLRWQVVLFRSAWIPFAKIEPGPKLGPAHTKRADRRQTHAFGPTRAWIPASPGIGGPNRGACVQAWPLPHHDYRNVFSQEKLFRACGITILAKSKLMLPATNKPMDRHLV